MLARGLLLRCFKFGAFRLHCRSCKSKTPVLTTANTSVFASSLYSNFDGGIGVAAPIFLNLFVKEPFYCYSYSCSCHQSRNFSTEKTISIDEKLANLNVSLYGDVNHDDDDVKGETPDTKICEEDDDYWEEEEEKQDEPRLGDGGDGGGINLNDVPWGAKALELAEEVLSPYKDNLQMYAFRVTTQGYIYVRLDKLSNKYGCPTLNEMESFNYDYAKCLEEAGINGEVPEKLAIEVSSPGAERVLRVPDDLERFKHLPMYVRFVEDNSESTSEVKHQEGIFSCYNIDYEQQYCTWKLANVQVNKGKGKSLNRRKKSWMLQLPFSSIKLARLYLED